MAQIQTEHESLKKQQQQQRASWKNLTIKLIKEINLKKIKT